MKRATKARRRKATDHSALRDLIPARTIWREASRIVEEQGDDEGAVALIAKALAAARRAGYEAALMPKKRGPGDPWWWEPMKQEVAERYPEYKGLPVQNQLTIEMLSWLDNTLLHWPEERPVPPETTPNHTTLYRRLEFFYPQLDSECPSEKFSSRLNHL